MNDINATLERIIAMYDNGGNPQQLMQIMMRQGTPIGQMQSQMQNMAQGRSPMEFIMQMARQNGVSEQNLQGIARILGAKNKGT